MKVTRLMVGALALALLLSGAAFAQQVTGQIEGAVLDQASKPLPGVKVTASSPAMMGERAVVTGADGKYIMPAMPPGAYALKFEMTGYQSIQITSITVLLGQITHQNATMKEGEIVETVTVKAGIPLVDQKTADTSFNLGYKALDTIPTSARTFRDLTKYVPSITGVDLNTSNGTRDGYPSIRGEGQYGDNYLVDGLTVRDPGIKTTATPVPYDVIKEVQIITDGFAPEYGQALGGTVNVITRTGSNEFSGEVGWVYSDDSLAAKEQPVILATPTSWSESTPYVDVGGAILKDKLWYFASYNRVDTDDKFAPTDIPGFGILPEGDEKNKQNTYFGKLSWAITPNHVVDGNYTYRDLTVTGQNSAVATPDARQGQSVKDKRLRGDYRGLFSAKTLLEVKYGYTKRDINVTPASPQSVAQYELADFGVLTHNAWRLTSDQRNRYDYAGIFTQTWNPGGWAGSHEFKIGYEYHDLEQISRDDFTGTGEDIIPEANDAGFNAGAKYVFITGEDAQLNPIQVPDNLNQYRSGGALANKSKEQGIFLQDRWEIGRVNVMFGARWDSQKGYNDTGAVFYEAGFGKTIAPRASITWDMTGDGVNIFKTAYGKFYDVQGTRFGEFANSRESFAFQTFTWVGGTDADFRDHIGDGGIYDIHNPANWEFLSEQSNAGSPIDYSKVEKPGTQKRFLVEYNRQLWQNYVAKVRYVNNQVKDLVDDVNIFYDPANNANNFQVQNFQRKRRDYQSLEFEFNGNPTPNISFNASYVHSASKGTSPGQFEAAGYLGSSGSGYDIGVFGDRPPLNTEAFYKGLYDPNTGLPSPGLGQRPQCTDGTYAVGSSNWTRYCWTDAAGNGFAFRDYNNDGVTDWRDINQRIEYLFGGLGGVDADDGWYGYLPYNVPDQVKLVTQMRFPSLYDVYFSAFYSWYGGYSWSRRGYQGLYADYLTFSQVLPIPTRNNPGGICWGTDAAAFAGCSYTYALNPVSGQPFNAEDGTTRGTFKTGSLWTLDATLGKVWQLGKKMNVELRVEGFNLFNSVSPLSYQDQAVTNFGSPLTRIRPRHFQLLGRFSW